MKTIYSNEFVSALTKKVAVALKEDGGSKLNQVEVKKVLDLLPDTILDFVVADGEIEFGLIDLCKFRVSIQEAKVGKNPKTGAPVNVPRKYRATAKLSPKFKKFVGEVDIVDDDDTEDTVEA